MFQASVAVETVQSFSHANAYCIFEKRANTKFFLIPSLWLLLVVPHHHLAALLEGYRSRSFFYLLYQSGCIKCSILFTGIAVLTCC